MGAAKGGCDRGQPLTISSFLRVIFPFFFPPFSFQLSYFLIKQSSGFFPSRQAMDGSGRDRRGREISRQRGLLLVFLGKPAPFSMY
jgi:hypothetical protein